MIIDVEMRDSGLKKCAFIRIANIRTLDDGSLQLEFKSGNPKGGQIGYVTNQRTIDLIRKRTEELLEGKEA